MILGDIVAAIGHTPMVELRRMAPHPSVRLFAKVEGANPTGSVKDRIARSMLADAVASGDRKSTRLNSSHVRLSRMPSSA